MFPFLAKLRGLGAIANQGIIQLSKIVAKSWAEPIHQLRRLLSLPPLVGNPFIDDKYSPYLVLAIFSRRQYVAARVAKHLRELLEKPHYTAKATAIGRIIQAENGVDVACDAIEKQLQA